MKNKNIGLTVKEYWKIKINIELFKIEITKQLQKAFLAKSEVTSNQMYSIAELCVRRDAAQKVANWFENLHSARI